MKELHQLFSITINVLHIPVCIPPLLRLSTGLVSRPVEAICRAALVVSSGVRRHPAEVTRLILYSLCQLPVNVYDFVVGPRLFK